MTQRLLKLLLQAFFVIFFVDAITFFMTRAAPGGPFSAERAVSRHISGKIDAYYGFDRPLWEQYARHLKNLAKGDLGPSYKYEGRTVNEIIGQSFPVSLLLGSSALLLALLLGIPAGVVAAARKNGGWDHFSMAVAMTGICLPTFVMGPMLALVFGIWLGWLNVSGWYEPLDMLLPAVTLGLYYAAYIARLTRAGMLEVLSQDYIRTAYAKGLSERDVLIRHALRIGLLPVVSFLGPAMAGLVSGSIVIETIFDVPGLGRFFVNSVFNRDYSMVLGTVIFYAFCVVLFNMLVDAAQAWLDPKQRNA